MRKRVCIVLVNWNGWKDTIECLESIFSMEYQEFTVLVCDNGSQNFSAKEIRKWAEQRFSPGSDRYNNRDGSLQVFYDKGCETTERLVLISLRENRGFAAGNNAAIKYAMLDKGFSYVWLLNNDTVVDKAALTELLKKATQEDKICGSQLLYYEHRDCVQALGNQFNTYLGTSSFITELDKVNKIDFGVGASLLIPVHFFETVGFLDESYFLYYEEADLWQRMKGRYTFVCVPSSKVYHKEGASIGANSKDKNAKSLLGDFYSIRNRLRFMKKYFPQHMITVYAGLMLTIVNRIRRGQCKRVFMIIRLLYNMDMTFEEYQHMSDKEG